MSPIHATVHTEFYKGTFPFFPSLTITGKGGSVLHIRVAPLVLYNVYNVSLICKGINILLYDSLWRDKNLFGTSTQQHDDNYSTSNYAPNLRLALHLRRPQTA